ncbi:MAG: molecular chaperone HtpG [Candidatus Xenobiia bacterium LiM19]
MAEDTAEKINEEKGTISVQMDNMFPIIKKWLYSEKDIFLRELISNSLDAINKLRHLVSIGEWKGLKEGGDFFIDISVDKEKGTLSVKDNGIGMTADEVKRYINEVAFSGASEFIDKYKAGDEGSQIIGHFGLGFYSSFMVASLVEINSLSYREGSQGINWKCDGSPEFTLTPVELSQRGTEVVLHISSDETEFLDETRIRHIIRTYCDFLPVEIRIGGEVQNRRKPLWLDAPSSLEDSAYKDFYHYLYPGEGEPLFWIHLNVEFPVRAKGILYFPRHNQGFEPLRGKIKFYYNQVYVSDNLKDLIPDFLMNLQGVIDCPDMPLNVSRSYLQSDPTMKKLSGHIAKKVADELNSIYKEKKDTYISYWEEINPFVKFGVMQNEKFYEQVKDIVIFKMLDDGYLTLDEYLEKNKEKSPNKVYYASDEIAQSYYVKIFKDQGLEVLLMNSAIDSHLIHFLEMKNRDVKFIRIDSDLSESIVDRDSASKVIDPRTNKTAGETIEELFKANLSVPKLTIKVENLKTEDIPAMILLNEYDRRFREMSVLITRKPSEAPEDHTLVVNASNPLIKNLKKMSEKLSPPVEEMKLIIEEVYDVALLAQHNITSERLENTVSNTIKALQLLSEKIAE